MVNMEYNFPNFKIQMVIVQHPGIPGLPPDAPGPESLIPPIVPEERKSSLKWVLIGFLLAVAVLLMLYFAGILDPSKIFPPEQPL